MFRALAAIVGAVVLMTACGGGASKPAVASPVCALVAQLGQTGRTVERADVADPAAFQVTLTGAVVAYVRAATRLRPHLPRRLRADVDQMIAAARHRRFSDAVASRRRLDAYVRSVCGTPSTS